MENKNIGHSHPFNMIVIVAALGYFVDIYDLILFGIVKDPSLRDLGVADGDMFSVGSYLLGGWHILGHIR